MTNLQSGNDRPPQRQFRLDKNQGKLFGVCAGIANYTNSDPQIWRIGFVAATLLGFGAPVIMYLIIALFAD
ncbi:MAG: PspC domain-containing protein [Erythrobacter sp.]|jgi:phage shock protein C|nr:PspC domain-containing protein [Erythrobacter sp.]